MDEGEQNKEVYAHFGLSMQLAQTLEHAIVNSMIVLDLVPQSRGKVTTVAEWHERYDAYHDMQFEKTLGKLVRAAREVATMSDELVASLQECIRKRNFLAHHFFRVRAEMFMDEPGRRAMVDELNEIQALFERTTDAFEATMQPAWDRYGFTLKQRQQIAESYIRELSDKSADRSDEQQ